MNSTTNPGAVSDPVRLMTKSFEPSTLNANPSGTATGAWATMGSVPAEANGLISTTELEPVT